MTDAHEVKATYTVDEYYPDHETRTESSEFRADKRLEHKEHLHCAISGQPNPELHHVFLEWAHSGFVDWATVKGVATGEITELPVLDKKTDQPTGETFPTKESLIWMICKMAELRGFDWQTFDPADPTSFVDSMANMLPLSAKFHRHKDHGIHLEPVPNWIVRGWPLKPDAIVTPDERVKK